MGIAIATTTYLIPIRPSIRGPSQSSNNGNFSLAEADPPLGCCLLRERSFHRPSGGRGNSSPDLRGALVLGSGSVPRHSARSVWKTPFVYGRVSLIGIPYGRRALCGQSLALDPLQSDIRGLTANPLFCDVLIDFRLQR